MNSHLAASYQSLHDVLQTGIRLSHYKNGAFDNQVTKQKHFESTTEIIKTLDILAKSSLTQPSEKKTIRHLRDGLMMMGQMPRIEYWFGKEEADLFHKKVHDLLSIFHQDHEKRSS
jgi:hypothetical protein